jgi:Protein of unknown function (DUF1552)
MNRISRRSVLKSLGVGGALLPLLDEETAQAAGAPKRVLFISWSNGYWMPAWRPTGSETSFTFGDILSPLEPLKSRVIVIDGVGQRVHYEANAGALGWGKDQWYGGHDGYPAVLTGVPLSKYADFLEESGGDSVDQYISAELAKTTPLPFQNLVVGPWSSGGYGGTVAYKGKSPGVTPEGDPFNLYKKLFQGRSLPQGTFDKARAARRSVLDYLGGSLGKFSARMGTDDQMKIQSHLDSIREIERQLGDPSMTLNCTTPNPGSNFDTHDDVSNYPKTLDLFSNLLVASFKCDLTRVATMTLSNDGGEDLVFSWLGSEFTGAGDEYPIRQYHDITHNAGKSSAHTQRKIRVEQWFYEQVAKIALLLDQLREGAGTMLDNTLIVVTNSMGENHDSKVQPFVLIGNLGGYFQTGRYLKFPVTNGLGTAHNGVLVAIANAMGVNGSAFGDPKYNRELSGLKG